MHRLHSLRLLIIAAALFFTVTYVSAAAEVRVVEHEMGTTEIEGTPNRVVVLEFSFVDALASLGITPVGIADDGDSQRIIPEISDGIGAWTSVGTRKQPSLEVISSLAPDLIIADLQRHSAIYDDLSHIAPTIVLPSLQATYEENLTAMVTIGEALGRRGEVEARLAQHQEIMGTLTARLPQDDARKFLAAVVWDQGFNAHTSSAYTSGVLESVGLSSALQSNEPYAMLNLEQLVRINPDVMFLMVSGEKTLIDEWKNNPIWNALRAVKNNQVYTVNRNLWSRFRGIISAELIAQEAIALLYAGK